MAFPGCYRRISFKYGKIRAVQFACVSRIAFSFTFRVYFVQRIPHYTAFKIGYFQRVYFDKSPTNIGQYVSHRICYAVDTDASGRG